MFEQSTSGVLCVLDINVADVMQLNSNSNVFKLKKLRLFDSFWAVTWKRKFFSCKKNKTMAGNLAAGIARSYKKSGSKWSRNGVQGSGLFNNKTLSFAFQHFKSIGSAIGLKVQSTKLNASSVYFAYLGTNDWEQGHLSCYDPALLVP